jgi:serine/threonine protein kinase
MELEAARVLFGLGQQISEQEIEACFSERRQMAEQRLNTAPTESLRAKYQAALDELAQARECLRASLRASAPHLSQTKLGDLPGAQPLFTALGSSAGATSAGVRLVEVGQVLANRYEIREAIGAGGMGGVYRAFDQNRGEEIAVKVLLPHLLAHPTARERFVAEAKISSKLSHPNIVNVFDVQRDGAHDFLTMELLRGQTMREFMNARKAARQPFDIKEAVELARAIGAALEYAHRQTVHRDIKPENVWVEQDGSYKLMDFGIARLLGTSQLTETRTALGTAYYMAPEQMRGARDVDGRADQYSLAVLLYEMLSGEIPAGRIRSLREINKNVPRGASQAIDRALAPQPSARYPNITEFVAALSARGSLSQRTQMAFGAALGALCLVAGGVMFWPQISALLPDAGAQKAARSQAVEAQGMVENYMKRIEQAERDLDNETRDARSAFDRAESKQSMARSAAEKEEASERLNEASAELELSNKVLDLSNQHVFHSNAVIELRGQLAVGVDALRDGRADEAAQILLEVRSKAEELLATPPLIRAVIIERGKLESTVADFAAITKQERSADSDGAASTAVTDWTAALAQADALIAGGKFAQAQQFMSKTSAELMAKHNEYIDALVSRYKDLVDKLTAAGQLDDAQIAIDKARKIESLRRKPS